MSADREPGGWVVALVVLISIGLIVTSQALNDLKKRVDAIEKALAAKEQGK